MKAPPGEIQLAGSLLYSTQVVGESYYQDSLNKICGSSGKDYLTIAKLYYDDNNPYDRKAIRIEISGLKVGHLDREAARYYRARMAANGQAGIIVSCPAKIHDSQIALDLPEYLGLSLPAGPISGDLLFDMENVQMEELAQCQAGELVHLWVNKHDASEINVYRKGTCGGTGKIGAIPLKYSPYITTHLFRGGNENTEIVEIKRSHCKLRCKLI